jgi:phage shock protein E
MLKKMLSIFASKPKVDYMKLIAEGAVVVDVRTTGEFTAGHIKGAINVPYQSIDKDSNKIPRDVPVLLCCASGVRSGQAMNLLKAKGYANVYNGGGWIRLRSQIC